MACRTACLTQDHGSFGECARASHIRVGYCGIGGGDRTRQRRWDAELRAFDNAVAQGIQPDGTRMHHIRKAVEVSNETGTAYDGHGIEQFKIRQSHGAELREAEREVKKEAFGEN